MKKIIYIILWVLLGLLISFILHAIIELLYLKFTNPVNLHWTKVFGGVCALPFWLIYLLPILGLIFGIWAGFFFWQVVYVKQNKK
jgi:hypothetical protein